MCAALLSIVGASASIADDVSAYTDIEDTWHVSSSVDVSFLQTALGISSGSVQSSQRAPWSFTADSGASGVGVSGIGTPGADLSFFEGEISLLQADMHNLRSLVDTHTPDLSMLPQWAHSSSVADSREDAEQPVARPVGTLRKEVELSTPNEPLSEQQFSQEDAAAEPIGFSDLASLGEDVEQPIGFSSLASTGDEQPIGFSSMAPTRGEAEERTVGLNTLPSTGVGLSTREIWQAEAEEMKNMRMAGLQRTSLPGGLPNFEDPVSIPALPNVSTPGLSSSIPNVSIPGLPFEVELPESFMMVTIYGHTIKVETLVISVVGTIFLGVMLCHFHLVQECKPCCIFLCDMRYGCKLACFLVLLLWFGGFVVLWNHHIIQPILSELCVYFFIGFGLISIVLLILQEVMYFCGAKDLLTEAKEGMAMLKKMYDKVDDVLDALGLSDPSSSDDEVPDGLLCGLGPDPKGKGKGKGKGKNNNSETTPPVADGKPVAPEAPLKKKKVPKRGPLSLFTAC